MKKIASIFAFAFSLSAFGAPYLPQNGEVYEHDGTSFTYFGPAAGEAGSQAISMDDARFTGWASGYKNLVYGTAGNPVADDWKKPANALGKASGTVYDILCLGDGGTITLTFDKGIRNGDGCDFAVFENGFADGSLELAYVEVSSDGVHFIRFPNFYIGTEKMGAFDNYNYAELVYNLASKYTVGNGHGFDLGELEAVYNYITTDADAEKYLSADYIQSVLDNYAYLDFENVNYVKITDIVGDGRDLDSAGNEIYDQTNCPSSPGFDLDGVGVINSAVPEPAAFAALFSFVSVLLLAVRRKK